MAETIYKKEEKQEVDRFIALIRVVNEEQKGAMGMAIKAFNFGVEVGERKAIADLSVEQELSQCSNN